MIVRRVAAGAAGLALLGTAVAVAPASAASTGTTRITVDPSLAPMAAAGNVSVDAVPPATLTSRGITLPATKKGKRVLHRGGLSVNTQFGAARLSKLSVNWKTGKVNAVATVMSFPAMRVTNVLKVTGGTKTRKVWKNADLKLNLKGAGFGGGLPVSPAMIKQYLASSGGFAIPDSIGKITIRLK